jgi:acyl carrier protein
METTAPSFNAAALGLEGTIDALRVILSASVPLQVPVGEIGRDDALFSERVGLDSLQGLTLLMQVEQRFGIVINELDWSAQQIGTLSGLADCIVRLAHDQASLDRSLGAADSWFLAPMELDDLPQGVRYPHLAVPEAIVERYVGRYSRPGEVVLDPFAGFGSTLLVALRLGRKACGVELDSDRHAYAAARLPPGTPLVHGDARHIGTFDLPLSDLCFTGPPFFASDRLLNMQGVPDLGDTYEAYLGDLQQVFRGVRDRLRSGGVVVAQFANLVVDAGFRGEGSPAGLLPLAWDAARAIDSIIPLVRDEIWCMAPGERPSPFAGRHGYFLIFQKP